MRQLHRRARGGALCGLLALGALLLATASRSEAVAARVTVAPAQYAVQYRTVSDWGSGFTGEITVTNRGAQRLNAWQLEFDWDRSFTGIWNGRQVSRTGTRTVVEGASWNSFIAPGASVSFGFNGAPGRVTSGPANLRLTADAPPGDTGGSGPDGLTVRYRTSSDWGSGFVGEVTVKNAGTRVVTDWKTEFDLARSISSSWNAQVLSSTGGHHVFQAMSYNQRLEPGQETTFGFVGNPGNVGGVANLKVLPVFEGGDTGGGDPGGGGDPAPYKPGYLRTSGANIVDQEGNIVRLTGLNWFGLNTDTYSPHGLWTRSMTSMLDQIASLGYNCLRIPYSNQLFDPGSTPNGIDFNKNPELVGKSGIQILDLLIQGAGRRGIKVILDRHNPGSYSGITELWYTGQYSEQRWIADWVMLARRYKDNPTVIGCDLHNEPHGAATWGDGNAATDWRLAAQRAGNAILEVNPNLLILVEGVERAGGKGYWWGGNLKLAGSKPVVLNVSNQLVYSTHDYPSSVCPQQWFYDPTYPANLPPLWDEYWGYLLKNGTAPVLVGEFGTFNQSQIDRQWFTSMAEYLRTTGASFTYWCWNPNSVDTGGILKDDWQTIHTDKQAILQPLLAPQWERQP